MRWLAGFLILLIAAAWWGVPRYVQPRARAWQVVAPGVEMRVLKTEHGSVTALRAAPNRIRIVGGGRSAERLDVAQWRRRAGALAAVNGGFFDDKDRAIGLRIARGRKVSPLHRGDWGVFYVLDNRARIRHTRDFKMNEDIAEAVQCGPRLVVDGRVVKLKDQWARRTALGIQRDGRVILAVANDAWSLRDWAALWLSPNGLNCPSALGLDGGPSTQLSIQTKARVLEIGGYGTVADAVAIQ